MWSGAMTDQPSDQRDPQTLTQQSGRDESTQDIMILSHNLLRGVPGIFASPEWGCVITMAMMQCQLLTAIRTYLSIHHHRYQF